jgi:antitoxin VapB
MGQEYTGKSFKSGNSVAIRVPAALGIEPDREWTITKEDGELRIKAAPPKRETIDVSGFWGKSPWLKPIPTELREFEERPSTIAARNKAAGDG